MADTGSELERRAAERIALLQAVTEGTPDALFAKDLEGRYVMINSVGAEFVGLPIEQIVGKTDSEVFPPDTAERISGQDRETVREGDTQTYEITAKNPQGVDRIYLTHKQPWRDERGEIIGIVGVSRDITEQRTAEEALRDSESQHRALAEKLAKSEALWRSIAENPFDFVVTVDRDHRFTFVNHIAPGLQMEDVLGAAVYDFTDEAYHSSVREAIESVFRDGEPAHFEAYSRVTERWYSSVVGPIEENGEVVAASILTRDTTDAKGLEEQLRHSQKMDAVGRLAGGIAHDFNNILTTIVGGADLALGDLGPDHSARELLVEIRKAGRRAAVLTRQLLAFSRKQVFTPTVVDVNELVAEMRQMLRRVIGEDITLRREPSEEAIWVSADAGQIEQVILNLALNSRDAMPDGGTLVLRSGTVDAADAAQAEELGLDEPGAYARLDVSDTGTGISPEDEPHLFEPFFTTKEPGKGTGLGLATSYGIVKQHGGTMSVQSEPGKGTTFSIYLPVTSERPSAPVAEVKSSAPEGEETVLVVEDHAGARGMVARMLRGLGYTVLTAETAAIGLGHLERREGEVDLLLTDVVLPGMGGRELADVVSERYPNVKVLFATGYTEDSTLKKRIAEEGLPLLPKPFTRETLAQKVREVLNGP